MIEQAKLTYSALGKAYKMQIKTVQDEERKQAWKVLKPDKQISI